MINNKIGGRNMVGRAVNRLAGRLTAVALTAAMAVSMLAGCAAGGKNTETAAKKEYKPSAMEQMNAKNDPNVIQDNYRTCYEVFVYSFFDSDGDGIGDLKGLTEKLDYIEGLGCNEIWMMPIMPSPSYHKYDITGSLCENNDKFAIDRMLPEVDMGDYLVIHDTGAHGFSMGYNYNGKLKSAELLLKEDGSVQMIRRAETPKDYFATFDCFEVGKKLCK